MRELRQLTLQIKEDGLLIGDELVEYLDFLQVIVKPLSKKLESQSEIRFRYAIPGKMHILGRSFSNVESVEVGPVDHDTTRHVVEVLREHHVSVAEMQAPKWKTQK